MTRRHTLVVAALLALSAAAGSLGLARTLELGAASAEANDAQVAAQERRLNAFEASLRRQLAEQPCRADRAPRDAVPCPAHQVRPPQPDRRLEERRGLRGGRRGEHDGGEAFEHEGGEDDD